jgi:predicted dehydrogenase
MLKVAILGFGFMGRVHAEAYARMPGARLVAVGGCREERLREWKAPYPMQFYAHADALLESSGADILDICLPTFMHEEFVTKAAERGIHVICEKPLALTLEGVDRMFEAVRKAGVTLMVAQVLRFFAHYTKCRELVEEGSLGDVFFASATRLAEPPRWGQWFLNPEKSGGALFDLQVHDLDYLMNLFGVPAWVFAVGLQSDSGSWDEVVSSLSYPSRKAVIEATYRMPLNWPFTSTLRLMGTDASLEYEFRVKGNVDVMDRAQHSLILYPKAGTATRFDIADPDPYFTELKYCVGVIENGEEPQALPLVAARNVIAVLEATKESLETGKVVELGERFALA